MSYRLRKVCRWGSKFEVLLRSRKVGALRRTERGYVGNIGAVRAEGEGHVEVFHKLVLGILPRVVLAATT